MEDIDYGGLFGGLQAESDRLFEEDRIRQENIASKGNVHRGFDSAVDSLEGSAYGAVGLLGDALGLDSVRDWGFEGYERNQREASLNPVDVQNFTDIESVSDAGKWFAGTLGQLAPSVAEGVVTTLIGAGVGTATAPGVGTAGGALAGLTGRKIVLKAIDEAVESKVKSGIAKEIAEREVKDEILKRAKLGGNIGLTQGVGAIEGGGMWGEDAEAHGVENANAGSAFALGQVSGLSEAYSPGGMLIKRIAGIKDAGSEVGSKVADTFLKRLGTEIPESMSGEAAQEVFQSFLGVLNKKIQDPTIGLADREAIHEYINSGAAGAAGGLAFGTAGAIFPEKAAPPPPPPKNHTVDDVLNEKAADDAVGAAVARQQITEAGPIQNPAANTVGEVLGEKQEDALTIIPRTDGQYEPLDVREPAAVTVQQPAADDIARLDPHLKEMAKSLYPNKEKGESLPDWVKLKNLKAWEKETGEDVKSYVSSTSSKETLKAVIEGKPLDAKQSKVWSYLKSIAENKAMVQEQKVPFDEGTGEFPDDWGKTIPAAEMDVGQQKSLESNVTNSVTSSVTNNTADLSNSSNDAAPEVAKSDQSPDQKTVGIAPGGGQSSLSEGQVEPGRAAQDNGVGGVLPQKEVQGVPVQNQIDAVDPNEERFADMAKILEAQESAEDVDALYHDMLPAFKRPDMAPYAERWTAARDAAAARLRDDSSSDKTSPDGVSRGANNLGNILDGNTVSKKIDGSVKVPSVVDSSTGVDSSIEKNLPDSPPRDAKESTNILKGAPLISETNGSVKRPVQTSKPVDIDMRGLANDLKVGGGVVESVPVDMVDNLVSGERSAKNALHDNSVLKSLPPGAIDNDADKPIAGVVSREPSDVPAGARSAHDNSPVDKENDTPTITGDSSISKKTINSEQEANRQDSPVGAGEASTAPPAIPTDKDSLSVQADPPGAETVPGPSPGGSSPALVEHTVKKTGKTIKGVVLKGVDKAKVQEIDKYTFPKDGGLFVREKHIPELEKAGILKKQESPTLEPTSAKIDGKAAETGENQQVKEEPAQGDEMTLQEMKDLLSQLQDKYDSQGMVKDGRLGQKIRQLKTAIEEEKAGSVKQPSIKNISEKQDVKANEASGDTSQSIKTDVRNRLGTGGSRHEPGGKSGSESVSDIPKKDAGKDGGGAEKPAYGASNKLVTADRAEELRKRLREKLKNLNSGIDPEVAMLGMELAVYHIEAGSRKFAQYVKAVVGELGEVAKPFVKMWYNAARDYPGVPSEGMDDYEAVSKVNVDSILDSSEEEAGPDELASAEAELKKIDDEIEHLYQLRECLQS